MSIPLIVNGTEYLYPETGDVSWGPDATDWAAAVTSGMLQKAGGLFQLLSEVDFGSSYGLKSIYFLSRTANPASAGQLRLARADVVSWRNQANDGNLDLGVNSSNQLIFNGSLVGVIASVTDTNSIDLTLTTGVLTADLKLSAASADSGFINSTLSIETDGLQAQVPIASAVASGVVSTATQTFAGNKTFTGTIAASNLSGTNTGDLTLASVGSSPANAGASLSGQVLTLQPADATHGGVVSTTTQAFAGTKQFAAGLGIGAAVSAGSGFDLEITKSGGGAQAVSSGYGSSVGGNFIGRQANGTSGSPTATVTDDALGTFSGRGYGASAFAGGRRGAFRIQAAQDWTDSNQGTYLTLQVTPNNSTTIGTALTIGNDSAAVFASTIAASNFSGSSSGTNTGDVTLASFGSSPAAQGASLSGQALTLQPADATHPGGVSTTTQSFAGDKTILGATTPLSIEISGNSATVAAQIKSSGNFASQLSLDSNRSTNGNTLGSVRGLWNGTVVGSIAFLAGVTAAGAKDDGLIAFFTRPGGGTNTQRMTIDSAGLVGVNMTPARQLDVTGTFGATGASTLGSTLALAGDFAIATNKFTVASASGNTLVAGTLSVTGDLAIATNKFTVASASGNTLVAGTLAVTSDFAIATSKFTVAAASGNTVVAGTLGSTGVFTPTGGIKGKSTNTNATAGNVGEYVESLVSTPTNFPGTTTQWGDGTSISLTAGDWDVSCVVATYLNGATMTINTPVGISTTSGNSSTGLVDGINQTDISTPASGVNRGGCVPNYRMSLGSTTTVYLKLFATYSAGNPQFTGRLSARRVQPGA